MCGCEMFGDESCEGEGGAEMCGDESCEGELCGGEMCGSESCEMCGGEGG